MKPADFDELSDSERHYFYRCEQCGEMVDMRQLDDVLFHEDHVHRPDIQYDGSQRFGESSSELNQWTFTTREDHRGSKRHPWFAAFFAFGTAMCVLTTTLLLFPGTVLDSLWRLNPDAHMAFQSFGNWSVPLMVTVGIGCAFAAIGLWQRRLFGVRLALIILSLNIVGDLFNALVRHDYRALIGLPIGGWMIFYLARDCNWRLARI